MLRKDVYHNIKKIPQFPVGEKECLQNSKLREKMDEDEESRLTRKNG